MTGGYDLEEVLEAIDPGALDYQGWVSVGMALHAEGYPVDTWKDWSRRDSKRYNERDFESKWRGFGQSLAAPVTGGTLVALAKQHGWEPSGYIDDGLPDAALDWDTLKVVDPTWVEPEDVDEPDDTKWDQAKELERYLTTLFQVDDYVGYVLKAFEREGRWIPGNKGSYGRTAGELLEELGRYRNFDEAIGTPNEIAGAWIRFNPLNGQGVRNADVAEFRYALVESDDMEIGKQKAIIEQLELPVACLVHSGGKSLHAIVKIEAPSYDEYRKRVDYLYDVCRKNGLSIDTQNKNPSRLSRMPGVMRNGKKQYLVATNIGKPSWAEWHDWIEELNDGLPEIEETDLSKVEPAPTPLVEDMFNPGDKVMISARSKAGKTFTLVELCVAFAEGGKWLDRQCQQGKVLYVNMEIKKGDRLRRFKNTYDALGIEPKHAKDIHVMDLRGKSAPLDRLANSIIRRAAGNNYLAIIIDPIYKVMGGDENSAEIVSQFCNQLDRLAEGISCAVVYCHHHSKGGQAGKFAMDRASGSGVFARDADSLIDMIELDVSDECRKARANESECKHALKFLRRNGMSSIIDDIPEDTLVVASELRAVLRKKLPTESMNSLIEELNSLHANVLGSNAWRIEVTPREMRRPAPINTWYQWPLHIVDSSGMLDDCEPIGSDDNKCYVRKSDFQAFTKWKKEQGGKEKKKDFMSAVRNANAGEPPTKQQLKSYLGHRGKTTSTVDRLIKENEDRVYVDMINGPGKAGVVRIREES